MGYRAVHALAALGFGAFVFMTIWDYRPPVHYLGARAEPSVLRAGSDVTVVIEADVLRDCPSVLNRSLVSKSAGAPVQLYNPLKLDHTVSELVITDLRVPHGFVPGEAVIKSEKLFICNPIQRMWPIKIELPSVNINVLPEDDEPTGTEKPKYELPGPRPLGKPEFKHALER